MLAYYGSRISENQTITPEGFLICHKVPIARTGFQDYLPEEVGIEGEGVVKVYRAPEEVFSTETLASFEGKPVTLSHPPTLVDTSNGTAYIKGHVQNVCKGEGNESDFIIADLFITDEDLIRRVQSGLREVSCGYEYAIGQDGDRIVQTHIRGNHVAVVENGRAGKQVAIKDEETVTRWFIPKKKDTNERSNSMSKKSKASSLIGQFFGLVAKDADPEAVAEIAEAIIERNETDNETPTPAAAPPATDNPPEEKPAKTTDSPMERMLALLEAISSKLDALGSASNHDNDPLEALLEEVTQLDNTEEATTVPADELPEGDEETETVVTDEAEESSQVVAAHTVTPSGEQPENPIPGADAAKNLVAASIRALKPIIAKLPEKERRAAADAASKALRDAMGKPARKPANTYAQVNKRKPATAAAFDSNAALAVDNGDLGKSIMAKHNPHYKKTGQ